VWPPGEVGPRVGLLLVLAGLAALIHGFRRRDALAQRAAWSDAAVSVILGVLAINAPHLAPTALALFVAATFAFDALHKARQALRAAPVARRRLWLMALGNAALCALFLVLTGLSPDWALALAGGLRILGVAWNIARAPVYTEADAGDTVLAELELPASPAVQALAERIEGDEELARRREWRLIAAFVVTLFAIHLGRMGFDRSSLGILSPVVALLGDLAVALIFTWLIYVPVRMVVQALTSRLEQRAWTALPEQGQPSSHLQRALRAWLEYRLRFRVGLRNARYSLSSALRRGLATGLPVAAVLAAIVPVGGMSWYFDTENWAAGVWDSWAAARTDDWREAMARATARLAAPDRAYAITPPGAEGDFSFVVIGDPGEGDASQWVLTNQLASVAARSEVRFVVVSSDVVYPTGAMRDYESNFWLPFKGVSKPVVAIPGNHDWYDGLDAFAATFFDEASARSALRARITADRGISATTPQRVDALIAEARRLRTAYGVPTGMQQAPYFQLQTPQFALIAVDTGVLRRVDTVQIAWLRAALEAARGKFKLVLLGHPFYAAGENAATSRPDFAALHALLREHEVDVVMGGDTHDLEYYIERGGSRPMHHFVNGGGGAYLSLGAALAPRERMPVPDWAHYPATAPLVAKIEANNSALKAPFWWWTRHLGGWPFSAEWLSAAFDYNTAPFFQSFIEVRVEPTQGRVRLVAHGPNGPLQWADLERSPSLAAIGAPDEAAEWSFALPPARP
jgi:3',5'-cyclic AMP phosphodiesterase CpdA